MMNEIDCMKRVVLQSFFCFLLIILFMPATHNAWSSEGQFYGGDGATINPEAPPGGWVWSQGGVCLSCHNANVGALLNCPDKTGYLKTGHKNVLRSVQSPPVPLTGPDGAIYSVDASGNLFDWTDNTINIAGFSRGLYYIFGGWMAGPASPESLFDNAQTTAAYDCGRCHTTGYTMDTADTAPAANRNPESAFPGITWTPGLTGGKINLDPDGDGPAVSSSWEFDGVQCERCHDASEHFTEGTVTVRGTNATALCLNCHRQEHTQPYAGMGLGSNIVPTPYTDNGSITASEPLYSLPAIEVGDYSGYAPQFYGYSTGMEFLNGAHAKFSGNFQQVGDTSYYASAFTGMDENGGGCTTCHDVHQSIVPVVDAAAPFKMTCPDCHAAKASGLMNNIYHPSGDGTPLGDGSDITGACISCHMPRPNNGYGPASHIFRISADSSYSTFPTLTQWTSGQKTANTAPDGPYAGAVWLDVDVACGRCHGASAGYDATKNGAPFRTKAQLASYSNNMHRDEPTVYFTFNYDSAVSFKVNFNSSDTNCVSGDCVYSWDFGDGSAPGSGVATSHTYSDGSTRTVTLTVTDLINGTSVSLSKQVTPEQRNSAPVASFVKSVDTNTWTVTVTDTSTDVDNNWAANAIRVIWGDFASSTGSHLGVFTHTYGSPGTFNISLTATDSANLSNTSATQGITLSAFAIGGKVTQNTSDGPGLSGATMTLKRNNVTVTGSAVTAADGTYSFENVTPGTYSVTAYKSGATFATTGGYSNPVMNIAVGPGSTDLNFRTIKTKFRITSTALGSTGSPISGVTITVKNSSGTTVAVGTTNTSGVYATGTTLIAGSYTVTAYRSGRTFSDTPQTMTFVTDGPDGALTFHSTTP